LTQEPAPVGFDHEHALFTRALEQHVRGERVDYTALSRTRADLDMYTARLLTQSAEEFALWSKTQQCAFWINAYNAFTLQAVLLHYPLEPLESLRDVGTKAGGTIWKRKDLHLGHLLADHPQREISLDELRDEVLRKKFKDARVHAAINNSCQGAPVLRAKAFTAAGLDRELDTAARAWLADPLRTKFSREQRSVEASLYFEQYGEDFARDSGSVEAWIVRYAPSEVRAWVALPGAELSRTVLPFDWKLNDVEASERH
jgi:hypothetical protein